ncbi:hypothetical protein EPUS_08975 [Endocarpon pusillum Z07020]|uniref:Protein kinase domain-containing protein n=1 Tax=Endocarpon pusillum (strain Z07020 / HMAS-L-300199) TaxID=1263415 RepID=U1I0P9_ENDPU|nr:uncharacterized protein EPUS_08975 [Endocarpon pusillum Z07020]ERF76790.1 hypothetical protein EPUS_08975 [Endocarpon pusillum Z07020]
MTIKKRWYTVKRIGKGAYGTVYLEREETDGVESQRAVKRVPKLLASGAPVDYSRELLAMALLTKHEEVFVLFHGWYESKNSIYLAMEYIPHGDLQQCVRSRLPEDEAKAITTQILEGLCVMHERSITHRDLKPQNIFVVSPGPNWWVKIGDFGISKRVESSDTALRTIAGTMNFIAPEIFGICEGSEFTSEYTSAVDIWSLGCVAYVLLTLSVPFSNNLELRKFCRGKLDFPVQNLQDNKVTMNALSFLKQLLMAEPSQRKSAQEALTSPWLTGGSTRESGEKSLDVRWSKAEDQPTFATSSSKILQEYGKRVRQRPVTANYSTPDGIQSRQQLSYNNIVTREYHIPKIPPNWQARKEAVDVSIMPDSSSGGLGDSNTAPKSTSNKTGPALLPVYNIQHPYDETQKTLILEQTWGAEGARHHDLVQSRTGKISTEDIYKFFEAASQGDLETLEHLIHIGIDVNTKNPMKMEAEQWLNVWGHENSAFGAPALVWAAAAGIEASVYKLLRSGADVDGTSVYNRTVMHMATKNGHASIFTLLLGRMANPAPRDDMGRAPIHWAAEQGHAGVVRAMISSPRVDIDARTETSKCTALRLAAESEFTALHLATHGDHIEVAQTLLTSGAFVDARGSHGYTPLHRLIQNRMYDTQARLTFISLLLDYGANINAETNDGHTALDFACKSDKKSSKKLLIQRGARHGMKDAMK